MSRRARTPAESGAGAIDVAPLELPALATFVLSPHFRIRRCSAGSAKLFGRPLDEIVGRHLSVLLCDEDLAAETLRVDAAIARRTGSAVRSRAHLRPDGHGFRAHETLRAIREEGRLRGYSMAVRSESAVARRASAAIAPQPPLRRVQLAGRAGGIPLAPEYPRATPLAQRSAELRNAIATGQFVAHYQPIVDLGRDEIAGFEALARWNHPTRGLLSPDSFIALAETSDDIFALDWHMFRIACRDLRSWDAVAAGVSPLRLSLNFSARHFAEAGFVARLTAAVSRAQVEPHRINLEITETALLEDCERTVAAIAELRERRFQFHIDDFGTGYSALKYLRSYNVDALKIDRSFVSGVAAGTRAHALVRSMIALAHDLDVSVIAEGVENAGELALLRNAGCDFAQGYHLSRPVTPAAAHAMAAARRT